MLWILVESSPTITPSYDNLEVSIRGYIKDL